jgi:phosphate/sulfate permease
MASTTSFASYRPSGRFSPLAFALFAAAIVAAAAAAWLYQSLMTWIPYIYVNFILCAGFGAGLGVAGAFAVRRGHCRNRILALVLAVPLAAAGIGASYYWAYRSTLSALADKNPETPIEAIRDEVTFERWVDARKEAGWTMTSSHSTPSRRNSPDISGAGVFVIWVIEALMLLGITLLLVDTEAAKPYCERCGTWCTPKPLTLGGLGREDVEHATQLGDLMPLVDIQLRSDGDPAKSIVLTGNLCDGCSDTAFLSVDERTTTQKKKQTAVKTVHLLKHAILTQPQRAAFVQRYNFAVGQKLAS